MNKVKIKELIEELGNAFDTYMNPETNNLDSVCTLKRIVGELKEESIVNEPDNWKEISHDLLWRHFIEHKHEPSGYFKVDCEGHSVYEKNSIHRGLCYSSTIHSSQYHELTWKDLLWELGVHKGLIVSDTHDCHRCPNEMYCKARFKYDLDQEQCSYWVHNVDPKCEFKPDYKFKKL